MTPNEAIQLIQAKSDAAKAFAAAAYQDPNVQAPVAFTYEECSGICLALAMLGTFPTSDPKEDRVTVGDYINALMKLDPALTLYHEGSSHTFSPVSQLPEQMTLHTFEGEIVDDSGDSDGLVGPGVVLLH